MFTGHEVSGKLKSPTTTRLLSSNVLHRRSYSPSSILYQTYSVLSRLPSRLLFILQTLAVSFHPSSDSSRSYDHPPPPPLSILSLKGICLEKLSAQTLTTLGVAFLLTGSFSRQIALQHNFHFKTEIYSIKSKSLDKLLLIITQ